MFLVDCPACGHRELRSLRALLSFANSERGVELAVACSHCGAEVRMVTGRSAGGAPPVAPPARHIAA